MTLSTGPFYEDVKLGAALLAAVVLLLLAA